MKPLLEVVGRSILREDISAPMRGISTILGNLTPSSLDELPVHVDKAEWIIGENPERLIRTFTFEDPRQVKDFVTHLIFEQEEMGHHAKITIDVNNITVETYTHVVNAVTELDKELAKFCDDLYRDVQDFYEVSDQESLT